jgi:hypothetical protein
MTKRSRLSDFLAAYLPFGRLCSAVLPHLVTVRGLMPASRDAWVSETFSRRIVETTPSTRSHVSLNFSGFARYWASVRGTVCRLFALVLWEVCLVFDDDPLDLVTVLVLLILLTFGFGALIMC